jgi:hypothetical protein
MTAGDTPKQAGSILSSGHPAIAALPRPQRWALVLSLAIMALAPVAMQRYGGQALGAVSTGLWIGAWTGAMLVFRRAGLVRTPFVVLLLALIVAAGALIVVRA